MRPYPAAVQLDYSLDYSQPQAGSCSKTGSRLVNLVEPVPDKGELCGGNTVALICNLQENSLTFSLLSQRSLRAGRAAANCIFHEVQQNLVKPHLIHIDIRHIRANLQGNGDVF